MLLTWGLLGTLAAVYYLQKHYDLRTVDDYERLFEEAYYYALWGGGGFAALIVPLVLVRRRINKRALLDQSFKAQPHNYDKKIIKLTGRVERVFNVSFGEKMRRRTTKLVRKITGSTDQTGANIQQRFLISSPQLKWAEPIFVIHNVSFGKLALRRGAWFEVQGEYLHQRSPRRNPWRRLFLGAQTHYGKLHCTHEPKGYIHRVGRPSKKALALVPVEIVEPKARRDAAGAEPNDRNPPRHPWHSTPNGRRGIDLRKDVPLLDEPDLGEELRTVPQLKYGGVAPRAAGNGIELRKRESAPNPSGSSNGHSNGNHPGARQEANGRDGRAPEPRLQSRGDLPARPNGSRANDVPPGARGQSDLGTREGLGRGNGAPKFNPAHPQFDPAHVARNGDPARGGAPQHAAPRSPASVPGAPPVPQQPVRPPAAEQRMNGSHEPSRAHAYHGLPSSPSGTVPPTHSPQAPAAPAARPAEALDPCSGLPPLRFALPVPPPEQGSSDDRSRVVRVPTSRQRSRR